MAEAALLTTVDPAALVDPGAVLGRDVQVGPFAIVEDGVTIGDGSRILASAHLIAGTEIGRACEIHMGAIVGHTPQVRDLQGPGGGVRIGDDTIVREHVTIHRASRGGHATVIGRRCLLLANSHVAHDCRVGDEVTLANGALLAGHVTVGDRAFISGNVCVHQFVRIGRLAMIGGLARVAKDVPPFMMVVNDSEVYGLNVVGLRRAGFAPDDRAALKRAFKVLYRSGLNTTNAVAELRQLPPAPYLEELIAFIEASHRGVCAGGPRGRRKQRQPYREAD